MQSFFSHLKSVFLIVIGREQNYTSPSLQEDPLSKLFRATANIQRHKFRFEEGLKLV